MPIADGDDAARAIDIVRAEFPAATHHCWAWAIDGDAQRSSDDGEPSGTAGRPILAAITSRELRHTLVVVVRWYGGTKLGTGGLVRAYSAAANAVLDEAATEPWVATQTLDLAFAYGDQGAVDAVLHAHGAELLDAEYDAAVRLTVRVDARRAAQLRDDLVDRTGGRVRIRMGSDH